MLNGMPSSEQDRITELALQLAIGVGGTKRETKARGRILNTLVKAGPDGAVRSKLASTANTNDYQFGSKQLDWLISNGLIERALDSIIYSSAPRWRLSIATIDRFAWSIDKLGSPVDGVENLQEFYNLGHLASRQIRTQRIAKFGRDVMTPLSYGDLPCVPPYSPPYSGWPIKPEFVSTPEPEPVPENFWGQRQPALDSSPENFWACDLQTCDQ